MIERIPLYGGSVTLEYDEDKHHYSVEGKPLAGVTSITGIADKPQLIGWAVKMTLEFIEKKIVPGLPLDEVQIRGLVREAKGAHRQKTMHAADIGTEVHGWVERHIKAVLSGDKQPAMPKNAAVKGAVEAFLRWEKEHKVEYIFSEKKIVSMQHWYAGTLDILALVDGVLTLLDIKTSKGVYEEHYLQTAGYKHAIEEEYPEEHIKQRIILHLSRDTGLLKDYNLDAIGPGYESDFAGFVGARALYRRLKGV